MMFTIIKLKKINSQVEIHVKEIYLSLFESVFNEYKKKH